MKTVSGVDLFCGGGGTSTGFLKAVARLGRTSNLLAINHDEAAIATHSLNHPGVHHLHEDLAMIDPRVALSRYMGITNRQLDILLASPECTSHSYSRGNRPISEQSRATALHPLKWFDELVVRKGIIENVPQMRDWGPTGLNGRPLKNRRGESYRAWLNQIRSFNYRVEERVLNSADYGAATNRERLFIIAIKGGGPIHWPEPTHAEGGSLFGLQPHRGAREVIDLDDLGPTIFQRRPKTKKWLAPKTLERIFMGLERFGGPVLRPWIPVLRAHAFGRSLDAPLPAILGAGQHLGLATPVVVQVAHGDNKRGAGRGNGGRARSVARPLPALTKENGLGVAQFVVVNRTNNVPRSLDDPMPVLNTGGHVAVVDARFLTPHRSWDNMQVDSLDEPLRTLDSASDDIGVVVPVVTDGKRARPIAGQFLVPQFSERDGQRPRTHSIEAPLPSPTSHGAGALTSWLVKFYGTGIGSALDRPLPSPTGKDRFGLVTPYGIQIGEDLFIDIRFRMLKVHELARGMGFPEGYRFSGKKKEQVQQIGNSVEVNQAEALCWTVLA